jgi:hypothetical protein
LAKKAASVERFAEGNDAPMRRHVPLRMLRVADAGA